jgi:sporulation protein YlmC with PRC-barrel domain
MHGNVVSAVSQHLTPDLLAKISSLAGISDRATTQKVVGAAVPAILSSLATLASKPGGERRLADAITKQSPRTLENLASMDGGSAQAADAGKSLLSSLLGGGSFSSLASGIGRFAGIGDGPARSILGMLTPIILGVLGREAGSGANGLTQLLAAEKDNFEAAMPAGLSDLLRIGGDRIGTVTSAAAGRRSETGRPVQTASPTQSQSSSNWVYWALPFLALAGLAWYFLSGERTSGPVAEPPSQARPQSTAQRAIGDLQTQITSAIDSLNGTLRTVKDRPSATDVLPNLQQAASELDRLSGLASRLPFEARDRLAEAVKTATARAKAELESVNAMPDLAPDAKPVIAGLRAKLDALAMTPASLAQQRGATSTDKPTHLTRLPSDAVSVSTYFDRAVHNSAGEKIGTVTDLIVGPDGKVVAAIISVGAFLGIGEKEVAVPFSSMQIMRRADDWHLVIEGTRDALREAPAFEGARSRPVPAPSTTQK